MSSDFEVWVVCAGVAAVARWIAARYPRIAPRTIVGVTAWFCAALAATKVASLVFAPVSATAGPVAAFTLFVLPSGVCVMLAAGWTMQLVGGPFGRGS